MENYLKNHIESFFREVTSLNANLVVIDSFLEARQGDLNKEFPFLNYDLITMSSYYRDLSQLQGGDNLYPANVDYKLSTSNLAIEVDRLRSYIACLTLTQVFEVFESFLKNIIAGILFRNRSIVSELKLNLPYSSFGKIRHELKTIQGTSNKGFIKVLRKISPFFKQHDLHNIWGQNMSHWFEIIAKVRHLVVHSRLIVSPDFESYIQEYNRMKLFNLHFTISETPYGKKLNLSVYQANAIVDYLFEYGHLIYKGLSTDFQLNQDIDFKKVSL